MNPEPGLEPLRMNRDLHGDETPDVVEDSRGARRRMNFLSPFFPSFFPFSRTEPDERITSETVSHAAFDLRICRYLCYVKMDSLKWNITENP